MKKIVESEGFGLWLKVSRALTIPIIIAGYAWVKQDLADTFITRTEFRAVEKQRDLETQLLLADLTKNMALLGQAVAKIETTIERRNP
jgi:hypothetical protein